MSTEDIYKRLAEKGVSPEDAAAGVAAALDAKRSPSRVRQKILNTIDDLGGALLFYDRKEDETLPVFALEDAIIAGVVTTDELVAKLREAIESAVESRRKEPGRSYP